MVRSYTLRHSSPNGTDTIQPCDSHHRRNPDFAVYGARIVRSSTLPSLKVILGTTVQTLIAADGTVRRNATLQIMQAHRTMVRQQAFCGSRSDKLFL
jgi:hypothetical protein